MIKRVLILLFLGLLESVAFAQSVDENGQRNIVPNPGFEMLSMPPIGWFYKGKHFTKVMKYWSSPTEASPDVFGPKVRVPSHWARYGFGDLQAKSGKYFTGITVYGCKKGKPHCREYIQIQLKEPLVIGQRYYVEMWVAHLPKSLYINNLGFYFSENKLNIATDRAIKVKPQVKTNKITVVRKKKWVKITGNFVANTAANYMVLGNFFCDPETKIKSNAKTEFKYAYYYLDNILVKKIPPILPIPEDKDDLSHAAIEEGNIIVLKNIFFEFDKSELLPRSFRELNKLVKLMKSHPTLEIEIAGHTDKIGEHGYNIDLSWKRAKAVTDYLTNHDIDISRVSFVGFGDTRPLATNDTEAGRKINRRVEFKVLKE